MPFRLPMLPTANFGQHLHIIRPIKAPENVADPERWFYNEHEPIKGSIGTKSNTTHDLLVSLPSHSLPVLYQLQTWGSPLSFQPDQELGLTFTWQCNYSCQGRGGGKKNHGLGWWKGADGSSSWWHSLQAAQGTVPLKVLHSDRTVRTWDVKTEALTSCGH